MSFTVVSVGATTDHFSSSYTMADPGSTASGDLLIGLLCANRNGTNNLGAAFPSGWTLLTEINETSTCLAMGYIARGGSAPSFSGTVGASGFDPGSGYASVVTAYRPTRAVSGDGSNGYAGAENTYQGTALTLSRVGLLVCAGGSSAGAINTFQNETVATTASGAVDTTTAPTSGAWIQRLNALVASSSRRCAIADAVPTSSGSSGRFRANVGAAGGTTSTMALVYAHFIEAPAGGSFAYILG